MQSSRWAKCGICLALLTGCGDLGVQGPMSGVVVPRETATPAQGAANRDREIEQLLAGKGEDGDQAIPADEFFAKLGQGYMVWKGDPEWYKKLAAEAKAGGAPAVYAVVGEAFGARVASEFVIVMPADPAARGKVIEAYNNFWKTDWDKLDEDDRQELQSEFAQDHGQKYLSLMYDP